MKKLLFALLVSLFIPSAMLAGHLPMPTPADPATSPVKTSVLCTAEATTYLVSLIGTTELKPTLLAYVDTGDCVRSSDGLFRMEIGEYTLSEGKCMRGNRYWQVIPRPEFKAKFDNVLKNWQFAPYISWIDKRCSPEGDA